MINLSEWTDITPTVQQDGPTPLLPIHYEKSYEQSMDYFRAVSAMGEYSKRALELTTSILIVNASHYSVWKYRLDILNNIETNLDDEWIFLNDLAGDNPKSYQIWFESL